MVYSAGARGKKPGFNLGSRQAWCSHTTGENENSLLDNLKLLELRKGRVLFGQSKASVLSAIMLMVQIDAVTQSYDMYGSISSFTISVHELAGYKFRYSNQ